MSVSSYISIRLFKTVNAYDLYILYMLSGGCENKKCEFYSTCESEGVTEGHCVCPQNCEDSQVNEHTHVSICAHTQK